MKLQTGSKQSGLLLNIKIKVMPVCIFGQLIVYGKNEIVGDLLFKNV